MKVIVVRILGVVLAAAALIFLRGERPLAAAHVLPAQEKPVGYADPAAIYCGDLGYAYEVRHTADGDTGICKFPDATSCEAWDFLEGKCGNSHSVCAQRGLETRVKTDGKNPYSRQYVDCVDNKDQSAGSAVQLANLEERATKSNCTQQPPVVQTEEADPGLFATSVPASFDWRARPLGNYMTGVRDQGQCGSCWAFASVGVAEAALNIANGRVGNNYNLAEEYLVAGCSGAGTCCGGWPSAALSYIRNSGIPDEACMRYVDGNYYNGCSCNGGTCDANCRNRSGGQCSDKSCASRCTDYAKRLTRFNSLAHVSTRDAIKAALVTKGPLSASIWMGGTMDANGVYVCTSAPQTSHVIVLVGYDDAGGYWIAKNSWGTGFEDNGYFKIGYGQCLVEDYVYYATVRRTEPIPQLPVDTISDTTPTYQWSRLPAATQYQLELKQGTAVIYTKTMQASACPSAPCSRTPSTVLAYGTYTWRVRAFIGGGWKGWSVPKTFTVSETPSP